tara:strand:+ start:290 stop:790 length:501 start_codon:yes stop_codon:yes gene_type:complete
VYDTKKLAKAVPCTKQCTASCTQCDGLKFKPDQKVEVVRSDGAMSPGYIVGKGWEGFDGPTYKARRAAPRCAALRRPAPSPATQHALRRATPRAAPQVQLDDGMCKQAVPEEEISDEVRWARVRAGARVRVRVRVTNPDPNPNQVRMSWLLGGWVGKAAGNRTAAK